MDQRICSAIDSKRVLRFTYDSLPRVVEPHAHGVSSKGNEVVRGFQTEGLSSQETLGWKLFTVAKIESLQMSGSSFDLPRPDYVKGDKGMDPVHCEL